LKVSNFRNSHNKSAYLYILTPRGIEEKINVTVQFLRSKISEYDDLVREIERLKREVRQNERRSNSAGQRAGNISGSTVSSKRAAGNFCGVQPKGAEPAKMHCRGTNLAASSPGVLNSSEL